MKKSLVTGILSAVLLCSAGVIALPQAQAATAVQGNVLTGTIQYGVNFRVGPSTSSKVIKMLKAGEKVTILDQSNAYFYKVRTSDGKTGYISNSVKYITRNEDVTVKPGDSADNSNVQIDRDLKLGQLFETGNKYLGTPYEYGSDRNTNDTFDCSDFARTIYREALNIILPADSRTQGQWIKDNSKAVYNISDLRPGDLIFFMGYKGSTDAAYQGIDRDNERINHVAVYIGNGQMIHTYSITSGGVRIDTLTGSWARRFLFGGSVLP